MCVQLTGGAGELQETLLRKMEEGFELFFFRHETGHETVGDSGANPNFREQICGVLICRLYVDVQIVERCNDNVDDTDSPQVALGVAFPIFARIEVGEHD